MAHLVVFPNQSAFEEGSSTLQSGHCATQTLWPPRFARGIAAPALMVSGNFAAWRGDLERAGVPFSGILAYHPTRREVPEAEPPPSVWREALGSLEITRVRSSLSDPYRLRVDVHVRLSLEAIIPLLARVIRGGTFRPRASVLVFEEEHRLVAFSRNEIVICRADDLLDAWIMVRTAVDLISAVWTRRGMIEHEKQPRQGIGADEIFKRLPATDCGLCSTYGCMEFARSVLVGRFTIDRCPALSERVHSDRRQSLTWLLKLLGLPAA